MLKILKNSLKVSEKIKYSYNIMSNLQKNDITLYNLIEEEKNRQKYSIELIASENYTSNEVMECLGSILTNKYSEGEIGRRYYGGCQVIDKIEQLCKDRALEAYRLNSSEWGVNVQPYSGSVANLAVYNALLKPMDTIMGLNLSSGGHLTHGYQTDKRKISISSIYYNSIPYFTKEDGYIDYDGLENNVKENKTDLIICGASAYPRDIDYKRMRDIADIKGTYLMCDMAHISGLVATQLLNNPFEYCDVVTTTTHKTLRGPRGALIFYKKELEDKINFSVFPSIQGGPHQNKVAGIACQLREVCSPEFQIYMKNVKNNSQKMAEELKKLDYKLSTNGTENHLVLVDLKNKGITGSKIELICDKVNISINKNSVYGDKSALSPGGIRIGLNAITTRGCLEEDIKDIVILIDKCIKIGLEIQDRCENKKMVSFENKLLEYENELDNIRRDVRSFIENKIINKQ